MEQKTKKRQPFGFAQDELGPDRSHGKLAALQIQVYRERIYLERYGASRAMLGAALIGQQTVDVQLGSGTDVDSPVCDRRNSKFHSLTSGIAGSL